jgi:hypothetical protein
MTVAKLSDSKMATIMALTMTTMMLGHCGNRYLNIRRKNSIQQILRPQWDTPRGVPFLTQKQSKQDSTVGV